MDFQEVLDKVKWDSKYNFLCIPKCLCWTSSKFWKSSIRFI